MKVDPYKSKEYYERWKSKGATIEGISKENQKLITNFIFDMEHGLNVNTANKRGQRSYVRLNAYKSKLKLFASLFEQRFNKNIIQITKREFHEIVNDLRNGRIKRQDGKIYVDVSDYVKSFKAFWHWIQKTSKKKIEDITDEIDVRKEKPKWVYLDEKQFKKLVDSCKPSYKVLCYFALDIGLRPSELINTRVSDFEEDYKFISIRDEVSKTYGRKVKIMISREMVKSYIEENKFKEDDLIFSTTLSKINEYLKRRAESLFGDQKSKAGAKYSDFTVGDIRHISACYWLPRYPTQQGMLYRFGWKKPDKVFYYSEFLGMVDNIQEENLLLDVTKTQLEQEIVKIKKESEMMKESFEKDLSERKKYDQLLTKIIKNPKIMAMIEK